MKVIVNVIKKDKVFLFLPNGNFANLQVSEYYNHIRGYMQLTYPNEPYSFAIGEGEPYVVFVILNANNGLEESLKQLTI